MTQTQALEYIHSICWKGSVPGLGRTEELLERMGNPQKKLNFIHIAGTNGKGSTAAMLSSVLSASGYRVGLYTSPYIYRFHERMQVNGAEITDDQLCVITEFVKPLAESMEDSPTEFELVTAIAMEYFMSQNCDIVILEVGMGGELDSTNVIDCPELAIITNIGLDHTEFLGDTLEKIAHAKAGIIKQGCDVVLYGQTSGVEAVIAQRCAEMGGTLSIADTQGLVSVSHDLQGQVFHWGNLQSLHLPLLGVHQLHNASVVLSAAEVLAKKGYTITSQSIRDGLSTTSWPGRFEVLHHNPLFLVDGGHNPQCIESLVENIHSYLKDKKLTVLTGVLADKDYESMYVSIAPFVKEYVTVSPNSPRSMSAVDLAGYLQRFGAPVTPCKSIQEGVALAVAQAGDDGVVLAYGSLYMVGDIREAVSHV